MSASQLSLYRNNYPDPFLDIASMRLPKTQDKLLDLCYIFGTQHPQIAPIIKKLAKYPITKIVVNTDQNLPALNKKWKDTLENDLDIYEMAETVGLNYFTSGNVFIVIHKPFARFYECNSCGKRHPTGKLQYYINNKKISGQCPTCKHTTTFNAIDERLSNHTRIKIVLLDPKKILIERNEETGENWYFYNVSARLKKAIKGRKPNRRIIDNTPWIYVKAAILNKKVEFTGKSMLHLREPSQVGPNNGWGMPIILPALKDAYLNQVYKKADESLANERIVPARFVYPQPTSADPLRNISLSKWARFMGDTIRNYRHDKNAVMPVPFPVGVATIGGEAQNYNTTPLRQQQIKEIIGATGVPEGFLSEPMAWSGGSIQLRIIENSLMGYLRALDKFISYVIDEVANIVNWPKCEAKFKQFSKSDDVQMQQTLIQLAQMGKVPWKEVLDRIDIDSEEIKEILKDEQEWESRMMAMKSAAEATAMLEAVNIQMEAQSRSQDYMALKEQINSSNDNTLQHLMDKSTTLEEKVQEYEEAKEEPEPEERIQEAKADEAEAKAMEKSPVLQRLVDKFNTLPPNKRDAALARIRQAAPETAKKLEKYLKDGGEMEAAEQAIDDVSLDELRMESKTPAALANKLLMLKPGVRKKVFKKLQKEDPALALKVSKALINEKNAAEPKSKVDMRPLPEQKPPRRK